MYITKCFLFILYFTFSFLCPSSSLFLQLFQNLNLSVSFIILKVVFPQPLYPFFASSFACVRVQNTNVPGPHLQILKKWSFLTLFRLQYWKFENEAIMKREGKRVSKRDLCVWAANCTCAISQWTYDNHIFTFRPIGVHDREKQATRIV